MSIRKSILAAALVALVPLPAQARAADPVREETQDARNHLRAGEVMSLREIERIVLPRMKGAQYLGPEYDPRNQVYRLKFLKDGRVYFVDVDATTGRILSRR